MGADGDGGSWHCPIRSHCEALAAVAPNAAVTGEQGRRFSVEHCLVYGSRGADRHPSAAPRCPSGVAASKLTPFTVITSTVIYYDNALAASAAALASMVVAADRATPPHRSH